MRDYFRSATVVATGGMPTEFVETVRDETHVGETIEIMTQDDYMSVNSYRKVFKAKVMEKYEFVCVTTEGHFRWADIALHRWQNRGNGGSRS